MADIDLEVAKSKLSYNSDTGVFTWKVNGGCGVAIYKAGTIAGSARFDGYVFIGVSGKKCVASRLAFAFVHGFYPDEVDHINGDPSDNRIVNLRAATHQQNIANGRHRKNNTSGMKGVSRHHDGRWRSRIMLHGKYIHIGVYDSVDEAHNAYMVAARKHYGEFARAT